ncbi:MAG: phosphotransferase [Oscillospiraceae bacterium]|nr:phosphotransferase [Oscillospiraceae bacterium]
MRFSKDNDRLTIFLTCRIDTSNAAAAESEILAVLADNPGCSAVFDADELAYISSAGLRVLMKLRKKLGESMRIINASPEVYDIFDMTGFTELLQVEKRFRELSVEDCKVIGTGFYGTVYRIDEETIVKVYHSPDSLPTIRNEQRLAKRAFVKGVPTAISYDIVRVGDSYGSVFELLNAETFNTILMQQPERFEEILNIYVDFLKTVHQAEMDPGTLPMARDVFIGYLDVIRQYLTDAQYARLKALLSALPDDLHVVHGDFQMKNVMLVGEEPMLIDMDTLATGQPVFDLQALYVTYVLFGLDDPDNLKNFLGIPDEWGVRIWEGILRRYFAAADREALDAVDRKIRLAAAVRFLYLLETTDLKNGELGQKRIRRAQQDIAALLEQADTFIL